MLAAGPTACTSDPDQATLAATSTPDDPAARTGPRARLVAPDDRWFATEQGDVQLACAGTGAIAVVLVAGTDDPITRWDGLVEDIGQEVLMCRYAPPRPSTVPVTPATDADALAEALEASGLPAPYVLVGHDLGALTVQQFGADHGQVLGGALLLAGAAPSNLDQRRQELTAQGWDVDDALALADASASWPDVPLTVYGNDPDAAGTGLDPVAKIASTNAQRRYAELSSSGTFEIIDDAGPLIDRDQPNTVIRAIDTLIDHAAN